MLFFSKGRGGAGSSSIPTGTLEPLLLGVKSPSLLNFTETRYLPLKFGKFVENVKKLKTFKPWFELVPHLHELQLHSALTHSAILLYLVKLMTL